MRKNKKITQIIKLNAKTKLLGLFIFLSVAYRTDIVAIVTPTHATAIKANTPGDHRIVLITSPYRGDRIVEQRLKDFGVYSKKVRFI